MKKKIIILTMIFIFLIIFLWCQNNYLVISNYTYYSEKVPDEFDGFKIVQISDLHNKEFGNNNKRLIEKIKKLAPDIIVYTGDMVDSKKSDLEVLFDFARQSVEICPVYFVQGNHEVWLDKDDNEKLLKVLDEIGVECLENQYISINKSNSSIGVIGLNDLNLNDGTLEKLIINRPEESLKIVLAHEPQYFEEYCKNSVDIVFCGHAHGGQFRLPFIGGLIAPDQEFPPEYTYGEYENQQTKMYVSRALGNSVIPIRLFNLPEIVCVELKTVD